MAIRVRCESCDKRYLLRDTDAGRKFKCKNCSQVIVAPEPSDVPEERNLTKDTAERLCPSCDNATLKERTPKSGLQIDVCPRCNGQWLDGGELMQLTRSREAVRQSLSVLSWDSAPTTRRCPRCQTLMNQGVFLDDSTNLDFCEDCNGLWFDEGELNTSLQFLNALAVEAPRSTRVRTKKKFKSLEVKQTHDCSEWLRIEEGASGLVLAHRRSSIAIKHNEITIHAEHSTAPRRSTVIKELWPKTRIEVADIQQIYYRRRHHKGNWARNSYDTYAVKLLLKNGHRLTLLSHMEEERDTRFIAAKIAECVGVRMQDADATWSELWDSGGLWWVEFLPFAVILVLVFIARWILF